MGKVAVRQCRSTCGKEILGTSFSRIRVLTVLNCNFSAPALEIIPLLDEKSRFMKGKITTYFVLHNAERVSATPNTFRTIYLPQTTTVEIFVVV